MSAASERPKTCGAGFALPRGSLGGLSKRLKTMTMLVERSGRPSGGLLCCVSSAASNPPDPRSYVAWLAATYGGSGLLEITHIWKLSFVAGS